MVKTIFILAAFQIIILFSLSAIDRIAHCEVDHSAHEVDHSAHGVDHGAGPIWSPGEGTELYGTNAPSLDGLTWIKGGPYDIEDLRGKVALIRFWLVGCPYCLHTAPALNEFHKKYGDKGLIVLGIHHPKSFRAKDPELVLKTAQELGFEFPIAVDNDWEVLKRYWTKGARRSYTSVSFLIDKYGIIRFIHDGGEFYRSSNNEEADRAFHAVESKIKELLAE